MYIYRCVIIYSSSVNVEDVSRLRVGFCDYCERQKIVLILALSAA